MPASLALFAHGAADLINNAGIINGAKRKLVREFHHAVIHAHTTPISPSIEIMIGVFAML